MQRSRFAVSILIASFVVLLPDVLVSQVIHQYSVKRASAPLTIDGRLDETSWQASPFTDAFVHYQDGSPAGFLTRAKFLWDDTFLYVGFLCQDPDVWGSMTHRDDLLWHEEVIEILCDPDGDGLNYFEVQVNPLGTILDLFLAKPYTAGGVADLTWNLDSIRVGVSVDGTLNDLNDTDTGWSVEVALPFSEMAFMAPSLHCPPIAGEEWRILPTRYDYERTGDMTIETSSWDQTGTTGGFHVPSRFGRIIFSGENATAVDRGHGSDALPGGSLDVFPNPFNAAAQVEFSVPVTGRGTLVVFDLLGREVVTLSDGLFHEGMTYRARFDGRGRASGVYLCRLQSGSTTQWGRLLLLR